MRFKLLRRKSWSDESGVSEIVGNILILMITVILFTGIMAFVNQMPVPELATKADFSASVTFESSGSVANLNVTHVGGVTLRATEVTILTSVDDVTSATKLSADPDFDHEFWSMGVDWKKTLTGTSYSSVIIVTVVDDVRHAAIWVSQVSGGTGGNPPIILQRYVDSNPGTETADVVKEHDDFSLFCKITDLDGDLDTSTTSIKIDASALPDAIGGIADRGYDYRSGSWFIWNFTDIRDEKVYVEDLDGKVIMIEASDNAGHTTISSFKLTVTVLPVEPHYIPGGENVDEYGLPWYIKYDTAGIQGWVFLGELINVTYPDGIANLSDDREEFDKGESVYVRVASRIVSDVIGINDLIVTDTITNTDYTHLLEWRKLSTAANPFYPIGGTGDAAIFQCVFNTSNMFHGKFKFSVELQSSSGAVYKDNLDIIIKDPDSTISHIPRAFLYRDFDRTQLWGTKAAPFNTSGIDYEVYVSLKVQDTDISPPPTIGAIRIGDNLGGVQLYGTLNSGSPKMISQAAPSANGTCYNFNISLRYNNGDQWLFGRNAYTLTVSQFSDSNEGVFSFSVPFFIRSASASKADFFTGSTGIYSSKGGSTNFINPWYVTYTENNNFFTTRVLHLDENAPSTSPMYYYPGMALGDLDGDGDMDLITASNLDKTGTSYSDQGILLYFENTMNEFGTWQAPSILSRPIADGDQSTDKIEWFATGDINNDGDIDFAYATGNTAPGSKHQVIIFNNTYGIGGKVFLNTALTGEGAIRKIALEDMNGDRCADLIVLINGAVKVYDLTRWTSGLLATIPYVGSLLPNNIIDFDIADVNGDGMLDILTADDATGDDGDNGIKGVWVNNYTENLNPTVVKVNTGAVGFNPRQAAGQHTGDIEDLKEMDDGDESFSLYENNSFESTPQYLVNYTFKMDSPLASHKDPMLYVRARVQSASPQEVFYIWYSTDADGNTGKFTPVIVVSGASFNTYTFALPASVAGAVNFYVRVTDSSSSTSSTVIDRIDLDYIAIHSDRFGTYHSASTTTSRYKVVGTAIDQYTCVRAAQLDSDTALEVVVAKNGKWAAYNYQTVIPGWEKTNANFWVASGDISSTISISASLFNVEDVNGDGYSDIITARHTRTDASFVSQIVLWLHVGVGEYPWEIPVIDFFADMLPATETGSILTIVVGDVFMRS